MVHEIPTYPGTKPIRQCLRLVHLRKVVTIKGEVEKILKAGFIYPIPLTDRVSNIVPMTKKQGTIMVCVDYRDINHACPKDSYPMPFIDQLIDDCAGREIYLFMDGFSGYNKINISPADQHKTTFICPWGTSTYNKLPFGLKNAGATFQQEISYTFHDICHIVHPYLDDLPAHSAKQSDHPNHLREIFLHFRHYHIHLNPHKCVFCVESSKILWFFVSKDGIHLDPLKVEALLNLPLPASLQQLQCLQGKANFLHCFIPNCTKISKGYTRFLKHDTPFVWDTTTQQSFEQLKTLLVSSPLLRPPDYHHDYTLYLAAAYNPIGMVLVQDDDDGSENVIYYLSHNLLDA